VELNGFFRNDGLHLDDSGLNLATTTVIPVESPPAGDGYLWLLKTPNPPSAAEFAEMSRRRQLMARILAEIPVMVTMLDKTGRVLFLNQETERVLGWTKDEMLEHGDFLSVCLPDREVRDAALKFILSAQGKWAEWPLVARDGRIVESIWMNIRVNDLIVGIGIDLTHRRREQEENLRLQEEVVRKVERRLTPATPYHLTFRELTVLALVADGKTDREIADMLSIRYRTVQTHISNILAKMGAKVRTEAGVRAVREGIID
jgi:PAS domain S-box-containing protein